MPRQPAYMSLDCQGRHGNHDWHIPLFPCTLVFTGLGDGASSGFDGFDSTLYTCVVAFVVVGYAESYI